MYFTKYEKYSQLLYFVYKTKTGNFTPPSLYIMLVSLMKWLKCTPRPLTPDDLSKISCECSGKTHRPQQLSPGDPVVKQRRGFLCYNRLLLLLLLLMMLLL